MTSNPRRPGISEFWTMAGLSILAAGLLVLLLWAPWNQSGIASGRTLVFYCAAGMAKPVQEIVKEYEEKFGVKVQVSFGGTGKLYSTIRATGGKGDLFLAADEYHMDKAQKEGLVAETIPVSYLQPVMIVKASTQEKLKKQGKPVEAINDLLRPDLKVVTANPELASIGKLIKDALNQPKIGIWPKLEQELKHSSNRVSTVGTVNEVVTAVRTTDNTIGLVWQANARQAEGLAIVAPPEFKELKELIQVGILSSAKDEQATAALQFARYLAACDKGLVHFTNNHFDVIPDADVWEVHPEIHLSAGAMLKPGIEDVVKAFANREGVKIDTSFAGCGLLVAQMKSIKKGEKPGRFPDAYFACDLEFLEKVQQWFEAAVTISANNMVLIVQKGNPKNITKLEDLTRSDLKVGLGHPENSALGKLTDDLLKKTGQYDKVYSPDWIEKSHVVHADAGHDLVNKLRIGALDVAIVYRSNAKSNPENVQKHLDIIEIDIPGALARQPFAIAKDSPHKYLMKRLLSAIVAQQTADRFQSLGFRWVYQNK